MLSVDADDMITSIQDGTITIFTRELEGVSNYRTIEELAAALRWRPFFWRRPPLVPDRCRSTTSKIVPWFRSSYMLKMNDKRASEIPSLRTEPSACASC